MVKEYLDAFHVFLAGFGIFVVLHVVWPRLLRRFIKYSPEVGGEWVGQKIYILVGAFIVLMFLSLCYFGTLGRTEAGFAAIISTIAIMFGYGQLVPASFFASFEQVRLERANRLTVQEGEKTKVKMVVHNTGVVAWKTFRISLEAVVKRPWWASWTWISWFREWPLADGVTFSRHEESSARLEIINRNSLVQLNANLLAVGEPAILVFNMNAETEGEFRWRVRVTNDGAPGEKHDYGLKLVVDGT